MKEKKRGLLTNALRKAMKKSRNDNELLASLATASKELDDDDLFFVTGGAQYEADSSDLKSLVNNSGLSPSTQSAIQALIIDSAGGSSLVDIGSNAQTDSNHNSSDSSPVATFTNVQPAVFDEGVAGNLNLTSDVNNTTENVNVHGLPGNMGNDNNDIMIEGGQASVNTGAGDDTFNFQGRFTGTIHSGNGNDGFTLDETAQKNAEISVDAGDGFDVMQLFGASIKHSFSFNNGKFHMN